jgi:hypothetical protein
MRCSLYLVFSVLSANFLLASSPSLLVSSPFSAALEAENAPKVIPPGYDDRPPPALSYRGIYQIGNDTFLSIHNEENGRALWLQPNETAAKLDIRIESVSPDLRSALVNFRGRFYRLRIENPDGIPSNVLTDDSLSNEQKLSTNNQILFAHIARVVRPTFDPNSNTYSKDREFEKATKKFILENPSPSEVSRYITENSEKINFENFSQIEFKKQIYSRDEFNTTGLRKKENGADDSKQI